nr:MAG TPA: hypothetical protein [Caudoviricetes sp.]
MQYYLCIDPDVLPDEVWAQKYAHLLEIRELEAKANHG